VEISDYPAAAEPPAGEPNPGLRALALTAVIAGLVLVAGAAFVLSYQGIHQIALHAGVSPELARLYPVILDAMLVMSCAAALALRTAGPWTRSYVWACLILLLAAVAVGNALYAMNISLPAQPTRAVVAILPWALLLMGFGMLLAMLRHWRRISAASDAGPATTPESTGTTGRDGTAPRPPAAPAGDDPDVGPALSYEAEPTVPAGTAGPASSNGPAGGSQTAGDTSPGTGTQPAGGTPPAATAGPAAAVPTTTPRAGSMLPAAPISGAEGMGPTAGPVTTAAPAATATPVAAADPAVTATPVAAADPAVTAGPDAGPVPATAPITGPAPPAGADPQPPGTTVPFLERILSGPSNPNAPEAGGE
jgi:uncharacterized protein DUF2637